jgi:quercetin dioxygenase-like cupin family protein
MAKAKRKAKATRTKSRNSKAKASAKTARAAKKTRAAKRRPTSAKRQRFTLSHHRDEDFDQGLRTYSAYRDLGIAAATEGLVQAHVIRMTKPFDEGEVAIPHYHDVDFQMVYVLKGWFRSEFEGEGVHTFHAGSCWIQPPKIRHTVRGYSDDCELLEIVLPANFETVTLA